jgi:manganese-dependent inorganic pyrophosphatase
MPRQTFVVGHTNPVADSIVSALTYAESLRLQGVQNVISARPGEDRCRIRYIKDRFEMPLPLLIDDVPPRARDVMITESITGGADESAYCMGRRLWEHGKRAMPLADARARLLGLINVEDFAHILLDVETMRRDGRRNIG